MAKGERMPQRLALDVWDLLHFFGRAEIRRGAWIERFRPESSAETAERAWERLKRNLAQHGVPHTRRLRWGRHGAEVAIVFLREAGDWATRHLDPIPSPSSEELVPALGRVPLAGGRS